MKAWTNSDHVIEIVFLSLRQPSSAQQTFFLKVFRVKDLSQERDQKPCIDFVEIEIACLDQYRPCLQLRFDITTTRVVCKQVQKFLQVGSKSIQSFICECLNVSQKNLNKGNIVGTFVGSFSSNILCKRPYFGACQASQVRTQLLVLVDHFNNFISTLGGLVRRQELNNSS